MQRDLKIGLSLGVLLIGIVGAFFFRLEPHRETPVAQLQSIQELDERIAEKPRKPYLTDPSTDEFPGNSEDGKRPALRLAPPQAGSEELLAEDAASNPKANQPRQRSPEASRTKRAAEPATAEKPVPPAADVQNMGAPAVAPPPRKKRVAERVHVVKPGDTLGGLAIQYLGDKSRVDEIVQANRQVIADPNRLPVGATLQIPDADTPSLVLTPSSEQQSRLGKEKPQTSNPAPNKKANPQVRSVSTSSGGPPSTSENKTVPEPAANPADAAAEKPEQQLQEPAPQKTPPATPTPKGTPRFLRAQRPPLSPQRVAQGAAKSRGKSANDPSDKKPATAEKPASTAKPDLEKSPAERSGPQAKPDTSAPARADDSRAAGSVPPGADPAQRTYQVQRGDSLDKIADKVYGNKIKSGVIFKANRDKLTSPNDIKEGMKIVLP